MPIVGNTQNATTQTLGATTLVSTIEATSTGVIGLITSILESTDPGPLTTIRPALLSSLSTQSVQLTSQLAASLLPPDTQTVQSQSVPTEVLIITITAFYTYNASLYSHSTVFVTNEQDASTLANLNVPALTTVYTPSSDCVNRWMLAGGQVITRFAPAEVTPILVLPTDTASTNGFKHQDYTLFSMNLNGSATDPAYRLCQAYRVAPTYSPGICPYGQTVAEVTAYQVSASTGFRTFWQASCCSSGFTFGPEYPVACISTFSAPVQAYALVTSTPPGGALPSTVYQYEVSTYVRSLSAYSIFQTSSTTTLSTGLAIADPVVVAWQTEDHRFFPSDYAASLVKRFDLAIATSPPERGLSTGAKAGIGVGVSCGAIAIMLGTVVILLLRRRKRKADQPAPQEHQISEMADQDHDLAKKKWWTGGKWRSEADTHADPQELENKTVHVVPGPPAELEGAELQRPGDTGRVVYPARVAFNSRT